MVRMGVEDPAEVRLRPLRRQLPPPAATRPVRNREAASTAERIGSGPMEVKPHDPARNLVRIGQTRG
jgi:hypothetical protein